MPNKFAVVVTDLKTFEHLHLHILWLPDAMEPGFYRQTVSFNSFFHGMKGRSVIRGIKQYYAKRWDEFEMGCDLWDETVRLNHLTSAHDDRTLPTSEHHSIWEFYKAIGYDYKKQRWEHHA
jgi:hypothetical protein